MTESPRPQPNPGRTTKSQSSLSGPMLMLITALDTTWRAFIPPIAGTFLGIWLDHLLHITPTATIICLILGAVLSLFLIVKQLLDIQRPQK